MMAMIFLFGLIVLESHSILLNITDGKHRPKNIVHNVKKKMLDISFAFYEVTLEWEINCRYAL